MFSGKLRKILTPLKLRLIKCLFGFHDWKIQRSWINPTSKFTTDKGEVNELHHAVFEPTDYELECKFCKVEKSFHVKDAWTQAKPKKNFTLKEVSEKYGSMYRYIRSLQD